MTNRYPLFARLDAPVRVRHILIWCCMIAACLVSPATAAQTDTTSTANDGRLMRTIKSRGRMAHWGFVYLPAAYYSSENGFGVGGSVLRSFSLNGDSIPQSTLRVKGRATVKGRGKVEGTFDHGWGRQRKHATRAKVAYTNLARRFYGIGPNSQGDDEEVYRAEHIQAYVEHFHRPLGGFRWGLRAEGEHARMLSTEANGILMTDSIAGSSSYGIVGAGLLADYDSRDRNYSPTSGSHHQSYLMTFYGDRSDDHDFTVYHVDLRNYFSLGHRHVLATQMFVYGIVDGEPPFWKLAALGGRAHTRGYRSGRYLDRLLVAAQGEYRVPVAWRFGLVAFAGVGTVGPNWRKLQIKDTRPTIGAGLRFRLGDRDQVRGRFDAAFGQNSARVYLEIDEAF